MKSFIVVVVLFATACGAAGTGSSPTPSPTHGMGFDVVATEVDHTATLRAGQTLEVVLHVANGMNSWSHPTSSNTAVLQPIVDPAATAARGVTLAAFRARAAGEVEVTSTASPLCSPGQACPMYIALYTLKVTVTQ